MRCPRCGGVRKVYKLGGGYTLTNTGGVHVVCPMCNGNGSVPSMDEALAEKAKLFDVNKKEDAGEKNQIDNQTEKASKKTSAKKNGKANKVL